jgi:DNA-binding transcriptional ArsR family regulator
MSMDAVFKALADPMRRKLLDRLREKNGQTLGELGKDMGMTRQAVTKHLAILEAANLVAFERRGRERLHYLNRSRSSKPPTADRQIPTRPGKGADRPQAEARRRTWDERPLPLRDLHHVHAAEGCGTP